MASNYELSNFVRVECDTILKVDRMIAKREDPVKDTFLGGDFAGSQRTESLTFVLTWIAE